MSVKIDFRGIEPGETKTNREGITVTRSECGNYYSWYFDGVKNCIDMRMWKLVDDGSEDKPLVTLK